MLIQNIKTFWGVAYDRTLFQINQLKALDTFGNYSKNILALKAVDTIGNCQRLAFTVGVSQHMHKKTNPWKFELNRSSNLRDNNERNKHPCHTKLCAFIRWLISRPQVLNLRSRNYFLLENYGTSEEAVSHNVLYHQPLPITRHQERLYANNYFE